MTSNEYKELFNHDFLVALSNWQKGWGEIQEQRRLLADILVKACENLPDEFKTCDADCYRKRFIVGGEIVPIILNNDFFEGIASWTLDLGTAKNFKRLLKQGTTFAMVFKQRPRTEDIIVNICSLWQNEEFKQAVKTLNESSPDIALPLLNFKDYQSEVILRTTLKGIEIEHIVGTSSSFEEICDMGNIPENEREALSIRYAKDPNGIPISFPTFASSNATREAVQNTIQKMQALIVSARQNNVPIYNLVYEPHVDDLKHRIE